MDVIRNRLRSVFYKMISRCEDKQQRSFENYGGRGIHICAEWRSNFQAFYEWAIANGYRPGLQIDRKDNDGNYEPGNCRFVTRQQNAWNKGKSSKSIYKGLRRIGTRWHAKIHLNRKQFHLGSFVDPADAARAYDRAAVELFGEFANLNFPLTPA